MKVELNENEIELLDKALVAYAEQPVALGLMPCAREAIDDMRTAVEADKTEDEVMTAIKEKVFKHRDKAMEESKGREKQVLFLRAKLQQAMDGKQITSVPAPAEVAS